MRAIITVTNSRSMPGTYTITCSARRDKRGYLPQAEVYGASGAAAKALEYAIEHGVGYAIVAPDEVSAFIPNDMRARE